MRHPGEGKVTTRQRLVLEALAKGQKVTALIERHGWHSVAIVHGARYRRGRFEIYTASGYWYRTSFATIFPK